jgi:hypothetical protein
MILVPIIFALLSLVFCTIVLAGGAVLELKGVSLAVVALMFTTLALLFHGFFGPWRSR